MKKLIIHVLTITTTILIVACGNTHTYKIGVSQCSEDIWREKQNDELRMSTFLYDNVELEFASADDDDKVQIEQINHFVDEKVDLLIVSPNQVHTISSAIDRAFDAGVPVILFDRKTDSEKYTAFMGADNRAMGRVMGEFVDSHFPAKGKILVIQGLKESSPAQERLAGFVEAIAPFRERLVVRDGDWSEESGRRAMAEALKEYGDIACVCAQNDRMAYGAYAVAREAGVERQMFFTGIDALPTEGGGIELVRDSILLASYIYPTRGDLLMRLAVNILTGQPYERENLLKSALVTADNAEVMLMQAEEMEAQGERLNTLHEMVDQYFRQYSHQRIYTILAVIIALLVIGSATVVIVLMRRRHQLEREALALVVEEVPHLPLPADAAPKPADAETTGAADAAPEETAAPQPQKETKERHSITELSSDEREKIAATATMENSFLEQLRLLVQSRMNDSDFGVEELAQTMGLSRVQLYRKVKALTGQTPVDIIRLSRLNRGKALLASGSMNISEVAYAVGFTAPSYFTKCFKDEFGILPGDLKG